MATILKENYLSDVQTKERLIGEYIISTFPVGYEPRYRIYENSDGTCYAVAGFTLLDKKCHRFVRPYGEGATDMQALKNALIHVVNLVLDLGERCNDFNLKVSKDYEY